MRLSYQVLQEHYVTVTEKLSPGLSADSARKDVLALCAWQPVAMDRRGLEGAWQIQDRYRNRVVVPARTPDEPRYLKI
jgi:hypothetical protein